MIIVETKEVQKMKKKKIVEKTLKKAIEKTLIVDANRTSCSIVYQPKAPAKLDSFKKTKV